MGCTWRGTMPRSFMYGTLYICTLFYLFSVCFSIFNMVLNLVSKLFIPCFGYVEYMDFYSFTDGACHHTFNHASATWVLYSPAHDLVSSGAVCIGPTTNNIVEYEAVIGLLTEAASWDIRDLVVFIDSHLVVCHLNQFYTIRNPILLRLYLRVHLLERSFEVITYRHIPREDKCSCWFIGKLYPRLVYCPFITWKLNMVHHIVNKQ